MTMESPSYHSSSSSSYTGVIRSPSSPRQRVSQYERNRRKNRAAAARCREKTKSYTDELRSRERDLSSQKEFLTACVASLRNEVLALKHEIFKHSDCNCDHIQKYLTAAAQQIT
ncbi:hypothetical protein LQW54_010460 [Pestalotiopsis sp. IQ-011]